MTNLSNPNRTLLGLTKPTRWLRTFDGGFGTANPSRHLRHSKPYSVWHACPRIWAFCERLTQANVIDALFSRFDTALRDAGYIAMSGQLVDSTLVAAPKQRNTDEEKKGVKVGKTAAGIWPNEPAKARQKDVDARRTVQFSKAKAPRDGGPATPDIAIPSFGYKNRAGICDVWLSTHPILEFDEPQFHFPGNFRVEIPYRRTDRPQAAVFSSNPRPDRVPASPVGRR